METKKHEALSRRLFVEFHSLEGNMFIRKLGDGWDISVIKFLSPHECTYAVEEINEIPVCSALTGMEIIITLVVTRK